MKKHDGRRNDRPKHGSTVYGEALHRILRQVFDDADEHNVPRRRIAQRLGVDVRTIGRYLTDAPQIMPAPMILELLASEELLPKPVRHRALDQLGSECGVQVAFLDDADIDDSPLLCQVAQNATALGKLSQAVLEAGEDIDDHELDDLRDRAGELRREANEMHEAIVNEIARRERRKARGSSTS